MKFGKVQFANDNASRMRKNILAPVRVPIPIDCAVHRATLRYNHCRCVCKLPEVVRILLADKQRRRCRQVSATFGHK